MRTEEEITMLFAKFEKDVAKRGWCMRMLLVLDQLFNVMIFNGSQDETVSSHIGRTGKAKWLCNILNKFESSHCHKSRGE